MSDLEQLRERFADVLLSSQEQDGEIRLSATSTGLVGLCRFLRDELGCDYPADLTAWDTGQAFVLWLRIVSLARGRTVIMRVEIDRENPVVPSLTPVWPGMNWHEREMFDLYGIRFAGHPEGEDPARLRILLPEDWEGFPFRKDYQPVFSGDPLHGPQETN